uniref:Uncharacterized protein n=1 Tax=Zea mays TaxID=4577 RepID=C0P819_MAIZE|nr:unknown [Zea mays]
MSWQRSGGRRVARQALELEGGCPILDDDVLHLPPHKLLLLLPPAEDHPRVHLQRHAGAHQRGERQAVAELPVGGAEPHDLEALEHVDDPDHDAAVPDQVVVRLPVLAVAVGGLGPEEHGQRLQAPRRGRRDAQPAVQLVRDAGRRGAHHQPQREAGGAQGVPGRLHCRVRVEPGGPRGRARPQVPRHRRADREEEPPRERVQGAVQPLQRGGGDGRRLGGGGEDVDGGVRRQVGGVRGVDGRGVALHVQPPVPHEVHPGAVRGQPDGGRDRHPGAVADGARGGGERRGGRQQRDVQRPGHERRRLQLHVGGEEERQRQERARGRVGEGGEHARPRHRRRVRVHAPGHPARRRDEGARERRVQRRVPRVVGPRQRGALRRQRDALVVRLDWRGRRAPPRRRGHRPVGEGGGDDHRNDE